jgi:hypothetical protein
MAQHSPELIVQTISVFKSLTGQVISQEEACQAVENVSGFFRVLQEWAEAERVDDCSTAPFKQVKAEEVISDQC